jgi:ABC-2 type transport system permease protein
MNGSIRDSITMLRRSFKHMIRYPSMSLFVVGIPLVLLLLFVYVFGQTMGTGLGAGQAGRAAYVNYVTPGILLIAIVGVAQTTALAVSMDMAEGIIARFRSMGISRGAVLTGHVVGNTIQGMLGVLIVIAVAMAIGFRSDAGSVEWLGALGLLAMATLAITWLSAALGLRCKSVEAASNVTMPLMLLVFIGSGFAPTAALPFALRGFAEYQPFTSIIETLRGLLMGTPIGSDAIVAFAWCALIAFAGHRWALRLYDQDPTRQVRLLTVGSA